jgi:hypothetical protein
MLMTKLPTDQMESEKRRKRTTEGKIIKKITLRRLKIRTKSKTN